jgi:hypothetical protein
LVNIIEEWEDFAKYAHDKVGFYQILGPDKNIEVRVAAGKTGFIREFENAIDPLLKDFGILRKRKKLPESRRSHQRRNLLQINEAEQGIQVHDKTPLARVRA